MALLQKSGGFTSAQALEFFLDWINDTAPTSRTVETKWLQVGVMLNNCFAISNLTRHHVEDPGNQAESKIQKFLNQVNPTMEREFAYFRNFMTNLKEDLAETEFKKDLTEYLTRIIALAK